MTLFVSKLSLGNAGNPIGKIIYDRPCELYDKEFDDEDVELEEYEEDDEKEEVDDDMKKVLIEQFQDGKLRQGWGYEYGVFSLNLEDGKGSYRDENGKLQPTEEWVCSYMHLYNKSQKQAIGRFRILSRLLDMEEDDIVFVPNIPSDDMFSVATVDSEGYEFKLMEEYYGHGHIIHVKDVEEYYYGDDTLPKKIWSFRQAVIRIRKEEEFKMFLEKMGYPLNSR